MFSLFVHQALAVSDAVTSVSVAVEIEAEGGDVDLHTMDLASSYAT